MAKDKFNPLTDTVKSLPRQSFDLAPDPEPYAVLDSTTPALAPKEPRRFDLNDLPRYADALYPKLKQLYPHIHDRMYGGWVRGCINDNACLFLSIDAPNGEPGAAGMAFIMHDPLDPVPYVNVLFAIGHEDVRVAIYEKIVKWARELSAKEVRVCGMEDPAFKKMAGVFEQTAYVLALG